MNIENMPLDTLKKLEDTTEKTLRDIRQQREELERQEKDAKLDYLKPIAIRAHDLLCSRSHCDGCGWGYEIDNRNQHNWAGYAHARWLKWAESFVLGSYDNPFKFTTHELTKILDVVGTLKKINPKALYLIRRGMNA